MSNLVTWKRVEFDEVTQWVGGKGTVTIFGTWASEIAQLEFSPDDGDSFIYAGDEGILSADGAFNFCLPPRTQLKVTQTGGTGQALEIRIGDIADLINRDSQKFSESYSASAYYQYTDAGGTGNRTYTDEDGEANRLLSRA